MRISNKKKLLVLPPSLAEAVRVAAFYNNTTQNQVMLAAIHDGLAIHPNAEVKALCQRYMEHDLPNYEAEREEMKTRRRRPDHESFEEELDDEGNIITRKD